MKSPRLRQIALALCAVLCGRPAAADNWLTQLKDNTLVCQLSIPGTHDSGTGEGFDGIMGGLFGESMARTQDKSLAGQWESGIRAFDLRPTAVKGSGGDNYLKIYHGIIETKIRFDEALRQLCAQLEKNPGEFAIVIVRHESDAENNLGSLWETLMQLWLQSPEFQGRLANFRHNLTVGELRGKILVLSRDSYESKNRPIGGYIRNWTHSDDINSQKGAVLRGRGPLDSPLYVQDYYDCTGSRLTTKLNALDAMLREGAKALSATSGTRVWVINHTSGYTSNSSNGYRDNATHTHRAALDYLSHCAPGTPTGIVMMDFAGTDRSGDYDVRSLELTRALIANNLPYVETGIGEPLAGDADFEVADGCVSARMPVTVYDLSGKPVAAPACRVRLPETKGVYLVKRGSKVSRILAR